MNKLFLLALASMLSLMSCAPSDAKEDRCASDEEACGPTCMKIGGSCCPNNSGYACEPGQTCSPDSTWCYDTVTCAAGTEVCGSKCMPVGNSCCSDDRYSCSTGYTCQGDNNQCVPNGSGTFGSPTNNVPGTVVVVTNPGSTGGGACGSCASSLVCSGWVASNSCSVQTCACYDSTGHTSNFKEIFKTSDGMCDQCVGDPNAIGACLTAKAKAMAEHCTK